MDESTSSERNPDSQTVSPIPVANLLQGVGKSHEEGKYLLNSSKVVDENGEPLVAYHGSDYTPLIGNGIFEPHDGMLGKGIYFTSAFSEACDYVRDKLGDAELSGIHRRYGTSISIRFKVVGV